MGNYTIFRCSNILGELGEEEIFTANAPKILDLKSSSEEIFSENWRWVSLDCMTKIVNSGERVKLKSLLSLSKYD